MANMVIHELIGKQYIIKSNLKINNKKEFLKGTVAPDLNKKMSDKAINKDITHYGKWTNGETKTNINKFLEDNKVNINQDFWKGYLFHLIVDHYFYNVYFKKEFEEMKRQKNGNFNTDFYFISKKIFEKYNFSPSEYTNKFVQYKIGKPNYLTFDKAVHFIEKMSSLDLEKEIDKIKEKEWRD